MLVALAALKTIGVVHTDIKPDNIMLVNHRLNPFKVKLIDFGIAKQVSHLRTGSSIQPNSYRAFEVTLGLPLNEGVDMWGLGCTLAFFYTGGHLFPSDSEYENMRAYVELYGQPENYLLNTGLHAKIFFKLTQETPEVIWKLKTPNEYAATIGEQKLNEGEAEFRIN
ncbi:hypothetical protein AMECASPLE_033242 [Ameca splendens]|uniref:Protein kinase domain-containing protein n=1 Tax=Ameca splendens TaxID=208324 RepID=A0ABV1A2Z6_9TELE